MGASTSWRNESLSGPCTGIALSLLAGKYILGVETVLRNEYSLTYLKNFPFYCTQQFCTMFTNVHLTNKDILTRTNRNKEWIMTSLERQGACLCERCITVGKHATRSLGRSVRRLQTYWDGGSETLVRAEKSVVCRWAHTFTFSVELLVFSGEQRRN